MRKWITKILGGLFMSTLLAFPSYAKTMYCTGNNVNIRSENNLNCKVLDQAFINTSFDVAEECDGFWKITTEDGYAYVSSLYLQDEPVSYSQRDLYLMAHLLAGEAQPCSDQEQRYVGSVALNRVKSSKFPNTLEEVIYQKGQYSCTWNGMFDREPTKRNWNNAKWLLTHGSILPDKVVFQSGTLIGKLYLKTDCHYYGY